MTSGHLIISGLWIGTIIFSYVTQKVILDLAHLTFFPGYHPSAAPISISDPQLYYYLFPYTTHLCPE